jgi:hypothetical protein
MTRAETMALYERLSLSTAITRQMLAIVRMTVKAYSSQRYGKVVATVHDPSPPLCRQISAYLIHKKNGNVTLLFAFRKPKNGMVADTIQIIL